MATVDWEFHKKQYAEDYAPKGMTKADYARLHDLPLNTARRVFSAIKLEKPQPEKPTKKPRKGDDINAAVRDTINKKARQIATNNRIKLAEKASDRLLLGDHPEESDHIAKNDRKSTQQRRSHGKAITPTSDRKEKKESEKSTAYSDGADGAGDTINNKIQSDHFPAERAGDQESELDRLSSLTFGRSATLLGLDADIQEIAKNITSIYGISQLQSGRLLQMTRMQNQMLASIKQNYADGKPWSDALGNPIPLDRALGECVFGPSEQMTQLETSLSRNLLVAKKLELDMRELHPLTRAERIVRTREVMALRHKEGWTAIQAAAELERDGIPLPVSLRLEAEKEISFMTPPVEEDNGITEEELERQAQEYMQEQYTKINHWLPSRRVEISELFAAEMAHQRGDTLTEGEFEEIETISQDEAEDGLTEFDSEYQDDTGEQAVDEVW